MPKITSDYVKLTSYSVMRVNVAAQVLSYKMSSVLTQFGPPQASATAEYCKMTDRFFDCLNVRSLDEPFTSTEDNRLQFLRIKFWDISETGKKALHVIKENLLPMLVQRRLCHGKHMKGYKLQCIPSLKVVKYLLQEGMEHVLTEKFCQDPCEEYFGNPDNPDLQAFGYNDNTIRIQRHISQNTGNTQGKHKKGGNNKWVNVIEGKFPKRNQWERFWPTKIDLHFFNSTSSVTIEKITLALFIICLIILS